MERSTLEERYNKAKKRVGELKGFYLHAMGYAGIVILLIIINLITSPDYLWFFWPMFGLSVSVVLHGMKVFHYLPFLGEDWEEQKIREFIAEEK